jgi:predicted peptidase
MSLKHIRIAGPFIVSVLFVCIAQNIYAANIADRFQARIYNSKKQTRLPYRLLVPKNYARTIKYPLVLFLHGSDERGTDNKKQLYVGLDVFASEAMTERYQCFIAAPQCPTDMKWADVDWKADRHTMRDIPTEALAMAIELVRELPKEFSIDTSRVYVTGYSMGGYGSWEAIQRRPDLFAAAVPVCGGGDESQAARIARIPVWAFHGALDQIVKVARSRNMVNSIVMAGGMPRYTEYPDINHFCWGLAFSNPEMFDWLFKQRK